MAGGERRIRVTAVPKERPDVHLYVLALIALARQLDEQQSQTTNGGQSGGAA
jgi:hypothetical protein